MILRVGRNPYLHAEPFYFDMERRGLTLYELVPSAVATALTDGDIQAGLVPLADCFRLADILQPVAGFCIATPQKTGSMFLYSTRPIHELHEARIAISAEAALAPQVLEMLLRLKYEIPSAMYVSLQETHDAFLLVGNDGLRRRGGARGFDHTYDLGAEWHAWTGLPLVFSRWMARKDVDPKALALLQDTLYVGLEVGVDEMYRVSDPREELFMLPRDITRYIRGFRYYIKASEQRAIDVFQQYMQQLAQG